MVYFCVVDVIDVLAKPKDASDYWTTIKKRLIEEEKSEIPTKCRKLKIKSKKDGKMYPMDTLDTEGDIFSIRKENLRDNMTDLEVAITNIGELATREIAKNEKPHGLNQNRNVAKRGGGVAKKTKDFFEEETGSKVLSK